MSLTRNRRTARRGARVRAASSCALVAVLTLGGGCFSGDEGGQFYGRVAVPRAQEFRWSDGGLPRVFDPARAAAPPDTDAVRALYEGLTDYDPRTLAPVSADAERWEASRDKRVWTFYLRGDARWSNGDPVTAQDYLRSWQRTLRLGDDAPHAELLANMTEVVGEERERRETHGARASGDEGRFDLQSERNDQGQPSGAQSSGRERTSAASPATPAGESVGQSAAEGVRAPEATEGAARERGAARGAVVERRLAVEAVDDHTLRVRLRRPDPNLPALLAHTIFRPVHAPALEGETGPAGSQQVAPAQAVAAGPPLVTNGAFRLAETSEEGVVLERAPAYRDASGVALERVRFVNERNPESALREYRDGKLDAVTNVNVEPAALKLLASYRDFERATFGALTYYDFNSARPPFDDVRVRTAFALAIDRKRLSEDTLGGSTVPAEKFLPTEAADGDDARGGAGAGRSNDNAAGTNDAAGIVAVKNDQGEGVAGRDASGRSQSGEAQSVAAQSGAARSGEAQQAKDDPAGNASEAADGALSLGYDPARARLLLAEAGYPGGYGFPRVRLLVNRNEQHRQVAEAVVEMWRSVLGVEAEIDAKAWDEYETKLRAGEYDVAKRSYIMQTTDEEQSVAAMFPPDRFAFGAGTPAAAAPAQAATPQQQPEGGRADGGVPRAVSRPARVPETTSEAQALREVPAIPVYFASSFALVKPYVQNFDGNLLGFYSLKRVRIDTGWRPPASEPVKVTTFLR